MIDIFYVSMLTSKCLIVKFASVFGALFENLYNFKNNMRKGYRETDRNNCYNIWEYLSSKQYVN